MRESDEAAIVSEPSGLIAAKAAPKSRFYAPFLRRRVSRVYVRSSL